MSDDYSKLIHDVFGAEGPTRLDFRGDAKGARQVINAWGEKQTKGKIKEMLSAEPAPETAMVAANTVYFKGTWLDPFRRSATKPEPFHIDQNAAHDVSVPMMRVTTFDNHPYLETDDFQMTLLLYGSWKPEGQVIPACMLVVLPKKIDGLARIEKSLTWKTLHQYVSEMAKGEKAMTEIQMPKFKMDCNVDLRQVVGSLGAGEVFDPVKADLSGIAAKSANGQLFISSAVHRAVIDVDEEGTEAAAETAIMGMGGKPKRVVQFRADHPFLFYIVHVKTDAILFMGRVMNPGN